MVGRHPFTVTKANKYSDFFEMLLYIFLDLINKFHKSCFFHRSKLTLRKLLKRDQLNV